MRLLWISEKNSKAFIHKSYIDENTCSSPENTRKKRISHILETAPTHATHNDEKMGLRRKIWYWEYIGCWTKCKK